MADEGTSGNLEGKIAALHQKIERESRFTRSLVVICTAAMLGVSLVPVKIMLTDLPTIIWGDFMTRLELVHDHWEILDKNFAERHTSGGASGAATPAAPATDAAK